MLGRLNGRTTERGMLAASSSRDALMKTENSVTHQLCTVENVLGRSNIKGQKEGHSQS